MDINSLEIKNKTNYDINNISHIDDFNVNLLRVTKKEPRTDLKSRIVLLKIKLILVLK